MPPLLRRVSRALAASSIVFAAFAPPSATADDEDALRDSLARDQARVIELISRPRGEGDVALAEDPELRAIAERMPLAQAALRADVEATGTAADPAALTEAEAPAGAAPEAIGAGPSTDSAAPDEATEAP